MATLLGLTDRVYLKTPLRSFCNDQIQYGHVGETTGYLRILSFGGYVKGGDYAAGLAALEAALDTIFSDPALEQLVIDVRINFGGADPYGLAIASRLATSEYLAYTKEARADPIDRNKWTPGDPSRVRPSARPGFRGPAVELIGPLTISAGETFTQALMGRTPRITRIGENTQGVFSDVLGGGFRTAGASTCRTRCSGRRREPRSTGSASRPISWCPCSRTRTWRLGETPGRRALGGACGQSDQSHRRSRNQRLQESSVHVHQRPTKPRHPAPTVWHRAPAPSRLARRGRAEQTPGVPLLEYCPIAFHVPLRGSYH